jgi:hypothetical protein
MKRPLAPLNQPERLKALESYSIILPEEEYDSITVSFSYLWNPYLLDYSIR